MSGIKGKSGGLRQGAGRPIKEDKKKMISLKLAPWAIATLEKLSNETGKSRAVIIEEALENITDKSKL